MPDEESRYSLIVDMGLTENEVHKSLDDIQGLIEKIREKVVEK